MSGAILGATLETEPPVEVLDVELVRRHADRLADMAAGADPENHQYPDLMHWLAPKTRSDALARDKSGGLVVRGLGHATQKQDEPELVSHGFRWRWVTLHFGQTLLIKGRDDLQVVDDGPQTVSVSRGETAPAPSETSRWDRPSADQPQNTDAEESRRHIKPPEPNAQDIQAVISYVSERIDDDNSIGRALRRVVRKGSTGEVAAFTAALVDLLRESVRERKS